MIPRMSYQKYNSILGNEFLSKNGKVGLHHFYPVKHLEIAVWKQSSHKIKKKNLVNRFGIAFSVFIKYFAVT